MDQRTKTCGVCGETKLLDAFAKHPTTRDGRGSHCRACDRSRLAKACAGNRARHVDGPSASEKSCPACGEVKAAEWFTLNPTTSTGLGSYCLDCNRARARLVSEGQRNKRNAALREARQADPERFHGYMLKKCYGITVERYNEMLERQGGSCWICDRVNADGTRLAVDHDHSCCPERKKSCGRCVRGLLCTPCNNALGQFDDRVERLRRAIDYLTGTTGSS